MRRHHRAERGRGVVTIGPFSGLRKLGRAMRRGKVPPERQVIIDTAMKKANERKSNG
jgi:hypothetical protein